MEQKLPETWEERLKKIVVPLSDGFIEGEELILMQNKIWLKEFESLKNFIDQEITTARLEAARKERERVLQEVEETFSREYCTRIECIDPKKIIQSIKNNL
jgi:hypothetical protein